MGNNKTIIVLALDFQLLSSTCMDERTYFMLHVTRGQTWPAPSPLSSRTARGVIPSRIPKILSQGHAVTEGMKHGRPSYQCATLEGADRSVNQCLIYARI